MKRISLIAALLGVIVLAFAGSALAGGGYGSQPGYDKATANTICAGHGAFGAFGASSDKHDFGVNYPGADGKPGADGAATALNNSSLCGNG